MDDPKPYHTLILDAGPIIKNEPPVSTLLAKSHQLLTVPAILSEIRDAATRSRLDTTLRPFLTLRDPRPESVKIVQEFARRSGDLQVLSRVDVAVLALAYEVECERNGGDWRLRKVPGQKGLNGSPPKKDEEQSAVEGQKTTEEQSKVEDQETVDDQTSAEKQFRIDDQDKVEQQNQVVEESNVNDQSNVDEQSGVVQQGTTVDQTQTIPETQPRETSMLDTQLPTDAGQQAVGFNTINQETQGDILNSSIEVATTEDGQPAESEQHSVEVEGPGAAGSLLQPLKNINSLSGDSDLSAAVFEEGVPPLSSSPGSDELDEPSSDSDSEGWITPSNLRKHQATAAEAASTSSTTRKSAKAAPTLQVATLTSDFAMQNVLLLMNLNLLSPSLARISHLKTYILRCHSCFLQIKELSKQFCPRCGKPTLTRVSCSTDMRTGEFKLHLKKNMQWNTRGDRYSIPKPTHGSASGRRDVGGGKGGWGNELILAEDQREYMRQMADVKRGKERDLMDDDFLPSILSGERHRQGGRPKLGAGRNVNSKRR